MVTPLTPTRVSHVAFISMHSCPIARPGERDTGGMSVYVRQTAQVLGENGISVDIFTKSHTPKEPQIVQLTDNTRIIHIEVGKHQEPKSELYQHLPQFLSELKHIQAIHGLRYDLIHSHYWLSGHVGFPLAQSWQVPHVATFHTLAEVKKQAHDREEEPILRTHEETRIIQAADGIIAFSPHEKTSLVQLYGANPEKITVIPCGVDLQLFQPHDKLSAKKQLGLSSHKVVLFVGRIEPIKGIDILLRAVSNLENRNDVRLVIVGGNLHTEAEAQRIEALAIELGLQEIVSLTGLVDQKQLPLYYNAADIFVLPSYYESFGLVALEAMACGTPVIAARVGGLQNVVQDGVTGFLVPLHQPDQYTQHLDTLLINDPLRRKMGEESRTAAENHSWHNLATPIINLYSDLVRNYRSHGCKE